MSTNHQPPRCEIHDTNLIRLHNKAGKTEMQCPICRILASRYKQQEVPAEPMRGDHSYDQIAKDRYETSRRAR